jgi:outer membrane protein OmpA-like peptidoglycan-associated protein
LIMKTRLKTSFVSAGIALIFLTGCVSSKKYKASQAELARVREDSTKLAQQVSSLNNNVQDLQNKNNTLQQSVESANSRNAATQKSLDYYQNYFKDQQTQVSQTSDDVKNALTQAGVSNGDVQQVNNSVHVRLDEDELFKKNSATVSAGGKKALDGLAGVIKNRSNMNVFVGGGDSTSGDMTTMGTDNGNASTAAAEPPKPRHHRRSMASRSSSGTGTSSGASSGGSSGSSNATASSSTAGSTTSGTTPKKKVHHHYSSEGGTAIYNNPRMHNRALALKQARMVAVADNFLQNGVEKVNVSLRQSSMNATPGKSIHVVLTPKMEDFSPRQ